MHPDNGKSRVERVTPRQPGLFVPVNEIQHSEKAWLNLPIECRNCHLLGELDNPFKFVSESSMQFRHGKYTYALNMVLKQFWVFDQETQDETFQRRALRVGDK